jgi:hypothetical protein
MRLQTLIQEALLGLGSKPAADAPQSAKKRYSERMSEALAYAFADELRHRGLADTRPAPDGSIGGSGAERRLSGGIGAKKVDVSWSTEQAGLLLGMSIKTINFRDSKTGNFQKNVTNRRGDMLFEAITLHRRFPYAALVGVLCLDKQAVNDGTQKRKSTFENVHPRLRLFSDRKDPAGRDEQFEFFYVALVDGDARSPSFDLYKVGDPQNKLSLNDMVEEILTLVAERNPDFYQLKDGLIQRAD